MCIRDRFCTITIIRILLFFVYFQVVNFLDQYESADTFIRTKTSIRQITQAKFVDIVHTLLKNIDDSIVITKINCVEELPFLMKIFCYPGKVDRNWLIIGNNTLNILLVLMLFE